jgi:hypothetical protein
MKQRSPIAVFFLVFITLGIYGIIWQVKTKNEMKQIGADIPSAWLLVIPFVSYYWLWQYSEGVEKVSNGETSAVMSFVLLFLLGGIGMAILQNEFNKLSGQAQPAFAPAPVGVGGPAAPIGPTPVAPIAAAPVDNLGTFAPATPSVPAPAQPITNPVPPVVAPAPGSDINPSSSTPQNGPTPPQPPVQPLVYGVLCYPFEALKRSTFISS